MYDEEQDYLQVVVQDKAGLSNVSADLTVAIKDGQLKEAPSINYTTYFSNELIQDWDVFVDLNNTDKFGLKAVGALFQQIELPLSDVSGSFLDD